MTDEYPTRRALREITAAPRKRIRPWGWALIGVGALILATLVWVGVRALIAKTELESALPLVSVLKDDLKSADLKGALAVVDTVADKTAVARSMTSDPVWRVYEAIPFLGRNLTVVRELAEVVDDIAQDVMVPVAGLGDTLDIEALKPVDGRLDLSIFEEAAPVISEARTALDSSTERVTAMDASGTLGPVADAHQELADMLTGLAPLMADADDLMAALPQLLGSDGQRNYLVVFQNNSEARALGGHAGSWVMVTVDDGKIDFAEQLTVHALKTGGQPVVQLAADQLAIWPGAGIDPSNVTMVPHLDLSAETAAAFWKTKTGVQPDAVVFIDPVALGYLLKATGPIELPTGDVIDDTNASSFLLNEVYLKYRTDAQQDPIFSSLAKLLFGAILKGDFEPAVLVDAVQKAGKTHRLLAWFFDEDERVATEILSLGLNELTFTDKAAEFGIYITDNLGSKMTYYVDAQVQLGQAVCSTGELQYQVKVTLTNTVTPELAGTLPIHVANRAGGALRVLVTLYGPPGSEFVRPLAVGWDPTFVTLNGTDGPNPAMAQRIILNPGESITGTYVLTAPDQVERALSAYVTPLARATPIDEFEFTC